MNSWYMRIVALSFILSLGISPIFAEEKKEDHEKTKKEEKKDTGRTSGDEDLSKKYDSLLEALKKSVSMKAIGADKKEVSFKIGGEETDFADQIKAVKEYRDKLKTCEGDESAKSLSKILDNYIAKIEVAVTDPAGAGGVGQIFLGAIKNIVDPNGKKADEKTISEKMVNTYTLQIRKLLEAKAKKFESNKADFSDADEKVTKALNNIAAILWAKKADEKFRETAFTEEAALKDSSTKKIVENTSKAIESLGEKTCKIDTVKEDVKKEETSDEAKKEEQKEENSEEREPAPPSRDGELPTDPTVPPGGEDVPPVVTPTPPSGGATPPFDAEALFRDFQNRVNQDNLLAQQQLQAALDAARRAVDDAALRQAQNDQLAQALLDQNQANDDALGEALQALGQQDVPENRSANRENSDSRSPQISPSIESGKGQSQIPPPPPVPQPPPQQGGFPLAAMMQPPPTQPLPLSYGESKSKFEDDMPRRQPVVVQDPRTSGLLELLKLQQQMLFASQQQRTMGVSNINTIGSRLGMYGRSMSRGPRTVNSRIAGTATSGTQGRIAGNMKGRTPLPPGLR